MIEVERSCGAMQRMARLLRAAPGLRVVDRALCRRYTGLEHREHYPRGHFYSPLPDVASVSLEADRIFQSQRKEAPGVAIRAAAQRKLLERFADCYYQGYDWSERPREGRRYHMGVGPFGPADSLVLYCMMRHYRPRRIIEVGAGASSALMLDVNEYWFAHGIEMTFIEPYPGRLVRLAREGDLERHRLMEQRVQGVEMAEFERLEANDILFIDSSHVSKAGSDVNHLLFEVLPRLKPGVLVHIHDIHWPFEYPAAWIAEGRAWNEAYLVRAFLQYNERFQIVLFNHYLAQHWRGWLEERMPLFLKKSAGSLWLVKQER